MTRLAALIILGAALMAGQAHAASNVSNWPALDADSAESNYNPIETVIGPKNALKLTVKWSAVSADQSYPVVLNGRVYVPVLSGTKVHVRILDAATGKKVGLISKDACGGMVATTDGDLIVAGHVLQDLVLSTRQVIATILPPMQPAPNCDTFLDPQADGTMILSGYSGGTKGKIYLIDPSTSRVVRTFASTSAATAVIAGHLLTRSGSGSILYDEATGRVLARPAFAGSNWFASINQAYTVASVGGHNTTIYAFDGTGARQWSRVVARPLATQGADWPHAVTSTAVYVMTYRPREGVMALDPLTGHVLWSRPLTFVQYMAAANNVLFVLSYGLGEPVRLVAYNATTGKLLGAKAFSPGFTAFPARNQLMIAGGQLFVRLNGPGSSELVAMGL
jgi:outer membrane protein assembly factor BamB